MSKDNVVSLKKPEASEAISDPLTDLLRQKANDLVRVAVEAEFEEYLSAFDEELLSDGRRRVVRNGHQPARRILTGVGAVEVSVPKSRSRSGRVEPFHSRLAPPFVRRAGSLDAAIPWLCPRGISTGDMRGAVSSLSEVYPETRGQRCWVHKTVNVLNYLPKSSQAKAKEGPRQVWMAETREEAERAFDRWLARYRDKYPKAADCLGRNRDALLAFYDFPARHWTHLRTTNVIESAFATIRHRSSRAKGCVTRTTMLSMIYKMVMSAEKSWKRLRGFRQLGQVIGGVGFREARK